MSAKSGYKLKFVEGDEKKDLVAWGKEKAEEEDDDEDMQE